MRNSIGIRYFMVDVDGTLTDGKIYMGPSGEAIKAFDVKDGMGLHKILPAHGITPVIVSGRKSTMVVNRATELEIENIYLDISDKAAFLKDFAEKQRISSNVIVYIGDDINDMPAMLLCRYVGCPADAVDEVKAIADYVCKKVGGNGAVREFIDWICKKTEI